MAVRLRGSPVNELRRSGMQILATSRWPGWRLGVLK
jgi:hypothetical protein